MAEEVEGRVLQLRGLGEDRLEADRTGEDEDEEDAEREAEIADAVDDEAFIAAALAEGFSYQKPISR